MTSATRHICSITARLRGPRGRRTILFALIPAVLLVPAMNPALVRTAGLAALDRLYRIYDPWSNTMAVDFGASHGTDVARFSQPEAERRLDAWFPEFMHRVRFTPDTPEWQVDEQFAHENLAHPQITRLREVADTIASDSDSLLDACNRFRELTRHGDSSVEQVMDNPLELLKLVRQGTPMTCRPFAVAFLGYCVSRGYTARLLGLSRDGATAGHAVVEVYAPEFGKWIVIDPDFNMVYRRGPTLLDAWELHDAWQQIKRTLCSPQDSPEDVRRKVAARRGEIGGISGVELMCLGKTACSDQWDTSLKYDSFSQTNIEYFEHIIYNTRNDYLSATYPYGHPVRVRQFVLKSANAPRTLSVCPEALPAAARGRLYWPVGNSAAQIAAPRAGGPRQSVEMRFSTWTPNFSAYEVRIDDGSWQSTAGPSYQWKLHQGLNSLDVRSINLAGLRGESARVEISRDRHRKPSRQKSGSA